MDTIVYHNARCSKSREVCHLLQEKKITFKTIEYLKTPLTEIQLRSILKKLGMKAEDIVRKKELLYEKKYKNKKRTEEQWIKVLAQNPLLIERPIVVNGHRAVIGRPPNHVLEIF